MQQLKYIPIDEASEITKKTPSELIDQFKSDGVFYYPVYKILDIFLFRYASTTKDVAFFKVPQSELEALIWKEQHTIGGFKLGNKPSILTDGRSFGFEEYGTIIQACDAAIAGGLNVERSKLLIDSSVIKVISQTTPKDKLKPETKDRYARMQKRVDEMRESNKSLNHTAICTRLAREFDCAPDTIRKNTKLLKY